RELESLQATRLRREAVVRESAVREVRPAVAARAVPLADENLQPALGGLGIGSGPWSLTAGERVAEPVERCRRRVEGLLEGREDLRNVDQHLLVAGRGRRLAEGAPVTARKLSVLA